MFPPCIPTLHVGYISLSQVYLIAIMSMRQRSWLCMTKIDITQMECRDIWWEHLSWDWNLIISCWSEMKLGTLRNTYEMFLTWGWWSHVWKMCQGHHTCAWNVSSGNMAGKWFLSFQCSWHVPTRFQGPSPPVRTTSYQPTFIRHDNGSCHLIIHFKTALEDTDDHTGHKAYPVLDFGILAPCWSTSLLVEKTLT